MYKQTYDEIAIMNKPKISILLPTRKRTAAVIKSIGSLLANAKDTSRIEILVAYDNDDEESQNVANVLQDLI